MCSTHATKVKFNTHVLWTLSFEYVKKQSYLSSRVWKTNFFLAPCIGRHGSRTYTSVRRISFSFRRLFLIFNSCKRKKIVFHICELKYKKFFYKLKAEISLHMCVKFYFSRVCRAHKHFELFIKLLIKISFFRRIVLFSLLNSKLKIFFYYLRNFHSIITNRILFMYFLRKWRSNIYLKKTI